MWCLLLGAFYASLESQDCCQGCLTNRFTKIILKHPIFVREVGTWEYCYNTQYLIVDGIYTPMNSPLYNNSDRLPQFAVLHIRWRLNSKLTLFDNTVKKQVQKPFTLCIQTV